MCSVLVFIRPLTLMEGLVMLLGLRLCLVLMIGLLGAILGYAQICTRDCTNLAAGEPWYAGAAGNVCYSYDKEYGGDMNHPTPTGGQLVSPFPQVMVLRTKAKDCGEICTNVPPLASARVQSAGTEVDTLQVSQQYCRGSVGGW